MPIANLEARFVLECLMVRGVIEFYSTVFRPLLHSHITFFHAPKHQNKTKQNKNKRIVKSPGSEGVRPLRGANFVGTPLTAANIRISASQMRRNDRDVPRPFVLPTGGAATWRIYWGIPLQGEDFPAASFFSLLSYFLTSSLPHLVLSILLLEHCIPIHEEQQLWHLSSSSARRAQPPQCFAPA